MDSRQQDDDRLARSCQRLGDPGVRHGYVSNSGFMKRQEHPMRRLFESTVRAVHHAHGVSVVRTDQSAGLPLPSGRLCRKAGNQSEAIDLSLLLERGRATTCGGGGGLRFELHQ